MGRYYNGDIEGKFWVAVQPSDAPTRFGGHMELSFSFSEDDIEEVQEELNRIEQNTPMDKLKKFFENRFSYNDEILSEANITREDVQQYADYELGRKILACLKETGECNFVGEL
tara:strand:- start:57 stop:398 length:342 start_codon:yes stop_codon:yes gene_type:complete